MERVITRTGLKAKEVVACGDKLEEYAELIETKLAKKDNPEVGIYFHLGEHGSADIYSVRDIDVKGDISKLSDAEKADYCDKGYRISAIHSPKHVQVKADLGLQKASTRVNRAEVERETLNAVLKSLIDSGMSEDEARALILPKG